MELIADLPGHSGAAWCVAWNPRRPLLATCSTDRTVRFYGYHFPNSSSSDGRPIFTYLTRIETGHEKTVRSIAWSPDGKQLVTGSFDATVGVWEEVVGSDEEEEEEGEGQDEGEVEEAEQEVPQDDQEPSGSSSGVFRPPPAQKQQQRRRRHVREWEKITTLDGHDSECKAVAYSSDGALLASCSRDKSVWVWEVQPDADFECISVMMEHTQDVKTIAWHPREEILASASYDATILLYVDDPDDDWAPFQKLEPRLRVTGELPGASSSSTKDSGADEEEEFSVPPLLESETIWSLAFSPCGQYLASGGDNGGIRLWARSTATTTVGGSNKTTRKWHEVAHVKAHDPRACFSLAWQQQQRGANMKKAEGGEGLTKGRLVSGGGDGKVVVWEVVESKDAPPLTFPSSDPIPRISLVATHVQTQAHGIYDTNAVSFNTRRYESEEDEEEERGGESPATAVSDKEKARRRMEKSLVATAGDDGSVRVWSVESK